jgi:glycosyltransferase involved in cell wall biosynthesis
MKRIAIYNPYLETRGGGEKVCLALAVSLRKNFNCKVTLVTHSKIDLKPLGDYFKISLDNIDVQVVEFNGLMHKTISGLRLPGRIKNIYYDSRTIKAVKSQNYDVFINNCYQSNLPNPTRYGVYMCMFPQNPKVKKNDLSLMKYFYVKFSDLLSRMMLHISLKSPLDSYRLVTANSKYTESYISKYWNRDSSILYPICENMLDKSIPKQKIILSVGRFFDNVGESHHKRHDVLIDAFSKMTDLHKKGWELHLAGSVAEDTGALKYILKLMEKSNSIPVVFHFNSSYKDLKSIYNEATIYWHATGYGTDSKYHPEKQEHFGITTVEAMSAECIPIVYNSAGQKESVENEFNGFLWDKIEQLRELTIKVSGMPEKSKEKLKQNSKNTASSYNIVAFDKNVARLFKDIL